MRGGVQRVSKRRRYGETCKKKGKENKIKNVNRGKNK